LDQVAAKIVPAAACCRGVRTRSVFDNKRQGYVSFAEPAIVVKKRDVVLGEHAVALRANLADFQLSMKLPAADLFLERA